MTVELANTIVNDILKNTDLLDVEKCDTLVYLCRVYPNEFNKVNNINKIIDDLD